MQALQSGSTQKKTHTLFSKLSHAFPPPASIDMRAAGIDISDASVRWVMFEGALGSARVRSFGERALAAGIVEKGLVRDTAALSETLREIKGQLGGIDCAHAALPEESAYVFTMHVPEGESREQVLRMIEFEFGNRVPIPLASAVYDFDVVAEHGGDVGTEIAVTVFPKDAAESYVAAFEAAGISLLSLEIEARSIARAIETDEGGDHVTLLVDFGRSRTGFAVLKRGIPIFTSTVEIGGESVTHILMKERGLSSADLERFKDEEGLRAAAGSPGLEALSGTASALADEVARHYRYWDTHHDKQDKHATHVGRVVMVGGGANLKGITDYVARRVHAEAFRGDIWGNVCSFEEYIPPIDYRASLQYATAVGLALRSI